MRIKMRARTAALNWIGSLARCLMKRVYTWFVQPMARCLNPKQVFV